MTTEIIPETVASTYFDFAQHKSLSHPVGKRSLSEAETTTNDHH